MKYFLFKTFYKSMWKKVKKQDEITKKDLVLPSGVTKKEYKFNKTKFNIYYKDIDISKPVVLDIHGGGWCYGDKDSNDDLCYKIALADFNVISLSYEYGYKATIKKQLQEINNLINYLYENKEKYHLDFSSFFLTGDSAGGQLSFLYAEILLKEDLKKIYKVDSKVKVSAAALNHPACYLKSVAKLDEGSDYIKSVADVGIKTMFYGRNYKKKDNYNLSEPNEILSSDFPPTLLISSSGDTGLSPQALRLKEDFDKFNVKYEFMFIENEKAVHVFNLLYPDMEDSIKVNNRIISFFKEHIN